MKNYSESIKTAILAVQSDRFLNAEAKAEISQDLIEIEKELNKLRIKLKEK